MWSAWEWKLITLYSLRLRSDDWNDDIKTQAWIKSGESLVPGHFAKERGLVDFNSILLSPVFSLRILANYQSERSELKVLKGGSQIALSICLSVYLSVCLCRAGVLSFMDRFEQTFLIDRYRPCLEVNFSLFRNLHFSEYFGHITVFLSACLRLTISGPIWTIFFLR